MKNFNSIVARLRDTMSECPTNPTRSGKAMKATYLLLCFSMRWMPWYATPSEMEVGTDALASFLLRNSCSLATFSPPRNSIGNSVTPYKQ